MDWTSSPSEKPPEQRASLPYLPSSPLEQDGKVRRNVNEQQFRSCIGRKFLRVTHDPYQRERN